MPLAMTTDGIRKGKRDPYMRILNMIKKPWPKSRNSAKKHYLLTFDDDRPVHFVHFDIDCHVPRFEDGLFRVDPAVLERSQKAMWKRVAALERLFNERGIDRMWYASPGRCVQTDPDAEPFRIHGLHCLVRIQGATPKYAREFIKPFMKHTGIDCEISWATQNRNVRFPGQVFLDLVEVDLEKKAVGVHDDDDGTARFHRVIRAYERMRPVRVERLLEAKGGRLMVPDDPEPVPQGEQHAGLAELDRLMAEGERELAEQEADPQGGQFEEFDRLIEREFAEQKEDPKGERFLKKLDRLTAPSGRGQEKRRKAHRSRQKVCGGKAISKPAFIPDDARIAAARTEPDTFNAVAFEPVRTTAVRMEVRLQGGDSSGVLEWEVGNGK